MALDSQSMQACLQGAGCQARRSALAANTSSELPPQPVPGAKSKGAALAEVAGGLGLVALGGSAALAGGATFETGIGAVAAVGGVALAAHGLSQLSSGWDSLVGSGHQVHDIIDPATSAISTPASSEVPNSRRSANSGSGNLEVAPSAAPTKAEGTGEGTDTQQNIPVRTPEAWKARRQQIEKKYDHAPDFGVNLPRGKEGFDEFDKAIDAFNAKPDTVHKDGTYRGSPARLNYNPDSKLIVVEKPDGSFLSGWKMNPEQLENVKGRGSL